MGQRVSVRLPAEQIRKLEDLVEQGVYPNRSEAIREAVRERLRQEASV